MDVHGAAGLIVHGLCHEGRVDILRQSDLAYDTFEHQDLISQFQRIAMIEVNLQLRGAGFVDHGVDIKLGNLAIFIDLLDQIFIFVDRFKAIGLRNRFGPARPSNRGFKR